MIVFVVQFLKVCKACDGAWDLRQGVSVQLSAFNMVKSKKCVTCRLSIFFFFTELQDL